MSGWVWTGQDAHPRRLRRRRRRWRPAAGPVTDLAERGKVALVEPFLSSRGADGWVRNLLDPDSVITSVAIASGLGATSARTWLKLPVVPEMERVLDATTLPTLLLGGDPTNEPAQTYATWGRALACPARGGPCRRRALLYPGRRRGSGRCRRRSRPRGGAR